ncbi:hypothetical protein Y047_5912 [Burkholderia pseudomallei MSHR3016]|nr:hypothetical protein Y047_5912 [Burkholderia pseudomallei MSHR3016]
MPESLERKAAKAAWRTMKRVACREEANWEEVAVPGGVEVPDDLPAAMIGESGPGAIEGQVVDGGQIV